MENINNFLEMRFAPQVIVALVYFAVLFPTFLFLKKKGRGFWWIFWIIMIEMLLLNAVPYSLLFATEFNIYLLDFFFFGILSYFLISLFLPLLIKKYIKGRKGKEEIFLAYFVLFLGLIVHLGGFFYLVMLSINAWAKYFN